MESPEEEENLALYQAMTGDPPDNLDEYLRAMKDNQRLVYEMSGDRSTPSPIEESSFGGRPLGEATFVLPKQIPRQATGNHENPID